ncbi:MAG: cellulase family glycosylhydrolase [Patescibacteria group bacterium]|nr:cellulase family glycosylhydrolase [Patescibacteria group bacterium]MDE2437875.1 cellulase family glycosylhydrolase [Patescibacteria group bacterium]
MHWTKKHIVIGTSILFILVFFFGSAPKPTHVVYGVTFSDKQARALGLDPHVVFTALVRDLHVTHIRIPFYWDEIETKPDTYDFSTFDWYVEASRKYNISLVPVLGRKLPRWPECFLPPWEKNASETTQQHDVLDLITHIVNHYNAQPSIIAWQIENEPFFSFGICPLWNKGQLEKEIAIVRSLDARPLLTTESGEWSMWTHEVGRVDVVGISLYRTSWWGKDGIGEFHSPIPPLFYSLKKAYINIFFHTPVINTELQMEPWGPKLIEDLSVNEQLHYFNIVQFNNNIRYAKRTGFDTVYLWGAEWWYFMKLHNHQEFWNSAHDLFGRYNG